MYQKAEQLVEHSAGKTATEMADSMVVMKAGGLVEPTALKSVGDSAGRWGDCSAVPSDVC